MNKRTRHFRRSNMRAVTWIRRRKKEM